jgi:hypothetical protein
MKKTHETDPELPGAFGSEGYITRPELTAQYEKNASNDADIGADSPPELMIARALSYRASEITNYQEAFDDKLFTDYAMDIAQRQIPEYVKDTEFNYTEALDVFLGRIDDGGWDDEEIMDIARGGEQYYGLDPEDSETLSESMFIRLAGLNERLETARSEVGYSPTKASRHAFTKATRASAADEIGLQLADMENDTADDRSIGDIVPINSGEWESYSGISPDPEFDIPSEKKAYLQDLAYDVAAGRVEMSATDVQALDTLIMDEFQFSFGYSVSGHSADMSADAQRSEYYDDKDGAVQESTTECETKQTFNESRFVRLAGLK